MFSKRSRTINITRGLAMAVGAVLLLLRTREKKIALLRKNNRTGRTTLQLYDNKIIQSIIYIFHSQQYVIKKLNL